GERRVVAHETALDVPDRPAETFGSGLHSRFPAYAVGVDWHRRLLPVDTAPGARWAVPSQPTLLMCHLFRDEAEQALRVACLIVDGRCRMDGCSLLGCGSRTSAIRPGPPPLQIRRPPPSIGSSPGTRSHRWWRCRRSRPSSG